MRLHSQLYSLLWLPESRIGELTMEGLILIIQSKIPLVHPHGIGDRIIGTNANSNPAKEVCNSQNESATNIMPPMAEEGLTMQAGSPRASSHDGHILFSQQFLMQ